MKVNPPNRVLGNQQFFSLVEETEGELRLSQKAQEEPQVEKDKKSLLEPEKTREFAEVLNRLFQTFDLELRFTVHEPTGEIIARIVNRQTGEVIREIPPEKFLDMVARLRELVGIFVDEIV